MRAGLLMVAALILAVLKGVYGRPVFDGVTFLVFVLVIGSLASYWWASESPRSDR